jgi:phosphoribosylformylglycinamidine (FGAM) synthase-like enzyme
MGEKKNYNLQSGVTKYQLGAASTIEWLADKTAYKARVLLEHKVSHDVVAINSLHEEFEDAERAIDVVTDSLNGVAKRFVYNIFAETIETHTSPKPGGGTINVFEVQALIWSFMRKP